MELRKICYLIYTHSSVLCVLVCTVFLLAHTLNKLSVEVSIPELKHSMNSDALVVSRLVGQP